MRLDLLFGFIILPQLLSAQNFTEVDTPFENVELSNVAFADVDGDNDFDVLITGKSVSTEIAKLYTNDGSGNFTEVIGTPFEGVKRGCVAFADVDGDNDNDVLITGKSVSTETAKLYINDGSGNFTEMTGTPFDDVERSFIAFADVDGDDDKDVLITGQNGTVRTAKLYINDGGGTYTEMTNTPFEGVENGSIAFADVDGDNDHDVLITGMGQQAGSSGIAKLYINDGGGNFTEMTSTHFDAVNFSSVAFADVDGDNDKDVLITGQKRSNNSEVRISKLYINDGSGTFTEMTNTSFEGLDSGISGSAFADVDGDMDSDVLLTGFDNSDTPTSKLYLNDGKGTFTEMTDHPFVNVTKSSVAFTDIDGDNDQDVLITGVNSAGAPISKLYTNNLIVSSTDELKNIFSLDFIPFPNPSTSNTLFLRYDPAEFGAVTVKVYNENGVLLRKQSEYAVLGQQTFSIDIASLVQGSYFIELDYGKRRGVAKFMVQ